MSRQKSKFVNYTEKMDHLLMHQWQRLMEIQQLQVKLMEEISQNAFKLDKNRG